MYLVNLLKEDQAVGVVIKKEFELYYEIIMSLGSENITC